MKTGFSKKSITPPLGAPIVGYYNERRVKGVLDELYVRAVAFDDGEKLAFLITLDLCFVSQTFYDEYKSMIAAETGASPEAVFITCSHTHTGPLVGKDFASELQSSPEYLATLKLAVRDAALYAVLDLKPTCVKIATTEAKGISFCRRYRMKDGSVATNPGVGNPNIDHALSEPNETVKVLRLVREGGREVCLVSFGTHPDSVGGEYISADYPGYVCDTVEGALDGVDCVFLQAPQGDVNHINPNPSEEACALTFVDFDSVPRGIEYTKHMGRVIAGAAIAVYSLCREIDTEGIAFGEKLVKLPTNAENDKLEAAREICRHYDEGRLDLIPYTEMALTTEIARARRIVELEHGPDFYTYKLSALRLGSLVFAGLPGEPFTDIGNRIAEESPFENTVICCLSNAEGAYIPTAKAYSEGGYEAASSRLKAGSDDIMVGGMNELLKEIL